jgi:hypothetical protein
MDENKSATYCPDCRKVVEPVGNGKYPHKYYCKNCDITIKISWKNK